MSQKESNHSKTTGTKLAFFKLVSMMSFDLICFLKKLLGNCCRDTDSFERMMLVDS